MTDEQPTDAIDIDHPIKDAGGEALQRKALSAGPDSSLPAGICIARVTTHGADRIANPGTRSGS